MKINMANITTKAVTIWNNSKPVIIKAGKITAGVLLSALAKCGLEKLGIDTDIFNTTTENGTDNILYFPGVRKSFDPKTHEQKIMYSIYKTTIEKNNDWYKLNDARKIAQIANDSDEISDTNFAIDLISEIASSMRDSYKKDLANDILMQM